jgi:hypothetical protein
MEVDMKRFWLVCVAAVIVAVGTGCRVAVDGPPLPPAPGDVVASFTAQGLTADPSPRARIPLPAGATRWVELRTGSGAAAQDLMYLEAVGSTATSVGVSLFRTTDLSTPMLVSRSPNVFARSVAALPFAAHGFGEEVTRSVVVEWRCLGACMAWRPVSASTRYYARITNPTSSSQSVDLFAYGRPYGDENEPNDTAATATPLVVRSVGDFAAGALESVGDRDFFRVSAGSGWSFVDIQLSLASEFAGDIVLLVGSACEPAGPITEPGQTVTVPSGTIVCVRTLDGTAGSAFSGYYAIIAE